MPINIYTDGAASNNGYDNAIGGYGWVMELPDEKPIVFGGAIKNATNNQMELAAMISALQFIQSVIDNETKYDNQEIFVFTDSAYIANCYSQKWYVNWKKNGWVNSKKQPVANKDQWKLLIPFFDRLNIHIVKVKGHADNFGNQIADQIAVAARTMDTKEFLEFRNNLMDKLEKI